MFFVDAPSRIPPLSLSGRWFGDKEGQEKGKQIRGEKTKHLIYRGPPDKRKMGGKKKNKERKGAQSYSRWLLI